MKLLGGDQKAKSHPDRSFSRCSEAQARLNLVGAGLFIAYFQMVIALKSSRPRGKVRKTGGPLVIIVNSR
jgi:hypothetical protein